METDMKTIKDDNQSYNIYIYTSAVFTLIIKLRKFDYWVAVISNWRPSSSKCWET